MFTEINTTLLIGIIGGIFSFCWTVFQYLDSKKREQERKDFEAYHKLIKDLVQPENEGTLYIDRQCAILFELRNFKRYYPLSLRMLKGLSEKWSKSDEQFPRLTEELNMTIQFLEKKVK